MYRVSFKTQYQCSLIAKISYKDSYPLPLKSYRCRIASLLYAGVELLKGLKIFERKDPHGYKKALCSTAESKESNMPNLLLTAIEKLLTTF